jgi:Uncharacterized protein conserved in bacteria (DUF2147)
MRKLLAIAALLLASTAAQAQVTFEYGGRTIRIDPERGTVQIPGIYDNTRKEKRSKNQESDRPAKQPSQQAKTDPQAPTPAAPAPAEQAPAAAPPPPPAAAALPPVPPPSTEPSAATAAVAPAAAPTAPPPSNPAPVQQDAAPAAPPAPAPTVATPAPAPTPAPPPAVAAAPPAPPPPAAKPAPVQVANSPLGVWLTEEKEGKVRIEQCGANLCGYAVDKKSNQNGEQILINMKPGKDKWSGRILDPNSGSTYDSTIAMKGADTLRVQGCAFGGMFCGGQTWTRVN